MQEDEGGGGPVLPKGHGGFEGLCTVPLVAHFQPHGSLLLLEQMRRVLNRIPRLGCQPSFYFTHSLSLVKVTFPLDFCAFGWEANGWAALQSLI